VKNHPSIKRLASEALALDATLEAEGPAGVKKAKYRKINRENARNVRKQKKAKGKGLVQDEARLVERAAGLLVQLERGGSTVLDDDGAVEPLDTEPFREDEEALQDLVDAKDKGERRRRGY